MQQSFCNNWTDIIFLKTLVCFSCFSTFLGLLIAGFKSRLLSHRLLWHLNGLQKRNRVVKNRCDIFKIRLDQRLSLDILVIIGCSLQMYLSV